MIIAIIPFILAVIGVLLYAFAANPKASEIGRLMFFCGLLVLTFALAHEVLRLG
jgi:Na+/phosphate symporter